MNSEDINLSNDDEMMEDYEFYEFIESLDRGNKEYRIEIDWSQFDEPQIQTLIAILFQSIDYSIEYLHQADRAREEGADLVVKKPTDSIALAVKIKPKNKDRQQLSDLSKRNERKKIYVYIQTPSGKFRESMSEYDGKVDFWDEKKLNDFFVKENLGFTSNLIFDSHKISHTILESQRTLIELHNKCLTLNKKATRKLDRKSFLLLFRLKDDAVSLHKPNENMITLLEKPLNIKNRRLNEHFLKIFLEYMDILNTRLTSFMYYFGIFYKQNEDLVHNSMIEHIGESHWLWICHYKSDNSLFSLQKELKEVIKTDKLLKGFPDKEEEKYWRERAKNNDVWSAMESRVRSLMIFGEGVEAIIDDIVEECAQEYAP